MTKEELLAKLKDFANEEKYGPSEAHMEADDALLDFINDKEVNGAFNSIKKWYD